MSHDTTHEIRRRSLLRLTLLGVVPCVSAGAASGNRGGSSRLGQTTDRAETDTTSAGDAAFSGSGGDYTITVTGEDVWSSADEYAAVYDPGIDGDFTVQATVESQDDTSDWAKAGLMAANDITAGGASAGDVIVAVTPGNGVLMQWDDDGDGYVSAHAQAGSTTYPIRLRLVKTGREYVGSYSTDGGASWSTITSATIDAAAGSQDAGLFATANDSSTAGTVAFSSFAVNSGQEDTGGIEDSGTDLSNVDTTRAGEAAFSGSDGDYAMSVTGGDIWTGVDEYGAIYETGVADGYTVETTVTSQSATNDWAKAGLMAADDIAAPGTSTGDVILGVTPGQGFIMQWDDDGDGYVSANASAGSTAYPARLRLEKSGSEFVGSYSTDGGDSWSTITTVAIEAASDSQDVGLFATASDEGETGTIEYRGFTIDADEEDPIEDSGTDRQEIDTTAAGDARFNGSEGDYTISAAGQGVTGSTDEYAAIYEERVGTRETTGAVEVTIESQEAVEGSSMAGVIGATDISSPGSSTGDVVVAATPDEGFVMKWDSQERGYVTETVREGSVSYPCRVRLEVDAGSVSPSRYIGKYSTDGGETWTEIARGRNARVGGERDMGIFATSTRAGERGVAEFSRFRIDEFPERATTDTTDHGDAHIRGREGDYTIRAAGEDVWANDDEYAAVYESLEGDVVAETVIESQEATSGWAKTGLMCANDITEGGSSAGDLIVAVTPDNGFLMQWDGDGDGYISESTSSGSTSYPCRLRVERRSGEYFGAYSTDDGENWERLGRVSPDGATDDQDIGVFANSSNSDTLGTVEVGAFDLQPIDADDRQRLEVNNTAGDPDITGSGDTYTIDAAGADVWTTADEYAGVYAPDVDGDVLAEVTVESQEDTGDWAKTGLMAANDITAAGDSRGDIILGVTPANGFFMQWDDDGDGYVSRHVGAGSTSYPVRFQLRKDDQAFVGSYMTENDDSWTEIGSTTISAAAERQDVGIFVNSSDADTSSQVEFTRFELI